MSTEMWWELDVQWLRLRRRKAARLSMLHSYCQLTRFHPRGNSTVGQTFQSSCQLRSVIWELFFLYNNNNNNWTVLRKCKPPPRRLTSTKSDLGSNLNFRINPDSGSDVGRIASKILCIHYLVGVSHFAECRENRPVTVWEIVINLLNSPIPKWLGKWKSDPESVSEKGSPLKVSQFFRLVGPAFYTKF